MKTDPLSIINMYVRKMQMNPLDASHLGEQLGLYLTNIKQVDAQLLFRYKHLFEFDKSYCLTRKLRRRLRSATVVFLCRFIKSTLMSLASIQWAWSVVEFIKDIGLNSSRKACRRQTRIMFELDMVTQHIHLTMCRFHCECSYYLPANLLD